MTTSKPNRTRKGKSSARPSSYSQLYKSSADRVVTKAVVEEPAKAQSLRSSENVDWKQEYGYVFSDLRKLFIVSAILFAGIVIIGFFL